jgi:hypothetical protein
VLTQPKYYFKFEQGRVGAKMKANLAMAIAMALCALIGLATSAELQNGTSELGEPSVEELAIRLLQATYPGSAELDGVQLLPGKLPLEMPVDLPIPDGARIVGSEVQENTGIYVVLDVPMTPDLALDFYREHLASQNWTEISIPGMDRGFVEQSDPSPTFCQGSQNASLTVTSHPQDNGTDLRLSIITDLENSPCSWDAAYNDDWLKPIPKLEAPKGTRLFNGNSVSGPGSFVAVSATLETEMNSSSLTAHYADQLTAANWTMMSEGESGPSTWSSWSFRDEDDQAYDGFLMALQLPGTDEKQKFILMQANLKEN